MAQKARLACIASQSSPILCNGASSAPPFDSLKAQIRGFSRPEKYMMDARRMAPRAFRLCFRSLFDNGRGYAFPCDGNGRVDLDELSENARNNYLYARAMVGRELATPAVESEEMRP